MNQKKYKKINLIVILALGIFLLPFKVATASLLEFSALEKVSVNEKFYLDILVDPESQSINSVGASVLFDPELFTYLGFSSKQSSIPVWVEEPKQEKLGTIKFSGVIPGGIERIYDPLNTGQRSIPIVRLFFTGKQEGYGTFTFSDAVVLKNDGLGTTTKLSVKSKSVSVTKGNSLNDTQEDLIDPEPFSIKIIERSIFGRSPRLAVFSSNDEGGGIERYEVSISGGPFKISSSPVPLPYKLFSYEFIVRAYDYSGNFREQKILVSGEKIYGAGGIIVIFILILGFIRYKFYNKKRINNEKI